MDGTSGGDARARWAAEALDRALWQAASLGLGLWQLLVGVLVAWRTPDHRGAILAVHVAVAALGVLALVASRAGTSQVPRAVFFAGMLAALSADLLRTSDTLSTTVLCMTFVVAATPFLVMRWQLATAVSGTAVACAAVLVARGGPGEQIALALAIPAVCYSVAALIIVTVLRRFAAVVDDADVAARDEHDRLVAAQASARTAAEYARTLHDTAINTLAAIAAGGTAVANAAQVRRRCGQDVAAIRGLGTGGRRVEGPFEYVGAGLSVSVTWTGLTGAELQDHLARLTPSRRTALRGIVKELLLNVEKHAGTRRAMVAVRSVDGGLRVVVSDRGVGLAVDGSGRVGRVPSVERRAAEAGIGLHLTSAPGRGTETRVECPYEEPEDGGADGLDLSVRASEIRLTATWAWVALVGVACVAITAVGTATPGSLASAGIVAALGLGSWWVCRDGRALPRALEVLVVLAVPVAFWLGFAGSNYGAGHPAFWPAVGLTPLLVVLLNVSRSPVPLVVAAGLLLATAAACAAVTWDARPDAAGTAIANAALQLAQLTLWLMFVTALDDISARSARAGRQALRDRADRAALDTARRTQERWRDAQLQVALDLLSDIAAGRRAPDDPGTQRLAGREEHALRQLLMLNPDLVHLGPWLARTIARTRQHDIRMTVRAGNVDLPDAASADTVGAALAELLDGIEAGTHITVAYFGDQSEPRVTVVGPPGFSDRSTPADRPAASATRVVRLQTQDMVELATPAGASPAA